MTVLVRSSLFVALACLAIGAAGCGRGFTITTPAGFAELEDQETFDYRAANSQGVVLAVRREPNRPFGDLTFWSGAIDAHLRRGGYVVKEAVDVSAGGLKGRQLRCQIERAGREHAFWVTVFVTEDRVITVEAGGDVEYFDQAKEAINKAIGSLALRG
jgi:hypothetical protein